jgi:hypothetical protein
MMATTKDTAQTDTLSHLENISDNDKQNYAQEEEVLGRDFTLSESELPDGYFTSSNFLGSSMLTQLLDSIYRLTTIC